MNRWNTTPVHLALLTVAVAAAYVNALSNGFVYDDITLVVNNPLLKDLHQAPKLFTTGYWSSVGFSGGLYRPLLALSFMLEYSFAGLNPFLYHLDNVLLHLLCVVLIYAILDKVFRDRPVAFISSLIFAAHPVHAEAVAWVSGRAELLSICLTLAAFLIYVRAPEKLRASLLSSLVFFCALLAKESALTLPILIGLHIVIYRQSNVDRPLYSRLTLALWPFALATGVYFLARWYAIGQELTPANITMVGLTAYQRALTMLRAFYEYVRLGVLPINLSVVRIFPPPPTFSFKVIFSLLTFVSLAVFSRSLARRHRDFYFAALWFIVTLLPVSNIIPIGIIMAERAMYLPSVGFCAIMGMFIVYSYRRRDRWGAHARLFLAASTAVVVALLILLTAFRNPFWRDQDTNTKALVVEWRDAVDKNPGRLWVIRSLAEFEVQAGDIGPEPEGLLIGALRLSPGMASAHHSLALLYEKRRDYSRAFSGYSSEILYSPNAEAYNGAGIALKELGRFSEGRAMYRAAIAANTLRPEYAYNLGQLEMLDGRPDDAYAFFNKAIALDPVNVPRAYLEQGMILGAKKMYPQAVEKLRAYMKLAPRDARARLYLAAAYNGAGMYEEAERELSIALTASPDDADALRLMARVRAAQGDHSPAQPNKSGVR